MTGVDILGSAGILKVNADGTVQRIVPRLTAFEAAATADTDCPAGSKNVPAGCSVVLSPSASAIAAFVMGVYFLNVSEVVASTALCVCELQLNGAPRPEFLQLNGPANMVAQPGQGYALALTPGASHTLRLAVWKSAASGQFTALHPHTKLTGVLVESFLS